MEVFSDLLMLCHAEYELGTVSSNLTFETFGAFGGGGGEVGLNGNVGFASAKTVTHVFREAYLDVRVEVRYEFCGVFGK